MTAYSDALDALREHHRQIKDFDLQAAFQTDPDRFARFSGSLNDLTLDFSKCAITHETMALLISLAQAAGVSERRDAMFAGEAINSTEERAVLHTALRHSGGPVMHAGRDVMPDVEGVLVWMEAFADAIRSGKVKGASGKPYTVVVIVAIVGSALAPGTATLVLAPSPTVPVVDYVATVHGAHITDTSAALLPTTTLF